MDDIDSAIVRELQANARLTNRELAARIGIAASTCHVRTRLLRDRGVYVLTGNDDFLRSLIKKIIRTSSR